MLYPCRIDNILDIIMKILNSYTFNKASGDQGKTEIRNTQKINERSTLTSTIIPEIEVIVKFYDSDLYPIILFYSRL
jgi:hypothetical protein